MIDIKKAHQAFEQYLDGFDRENERILLKIIHTEGVVRCAAEISKRMHLSEEDRQLAELIALLHDIGRFEQVRLFDSFEPITMDHAGFGVRILFEEKDPETGALFIRRFVEEDTWDPIIREAIARHSDYDVGEISDERTLLHAKLIRDADKLDNCRVKLEESLMILLGMTGEAVGALPISDVIWETCMHERAVRSADRVTKMDYWVSYVAYFYDIYFKETADIILEENYVDRIISRIPYSNPDTREKMERLGQMMTDYLNAR